MSDRVVLFMHVPKTGGTSVVETLKRQGVVCLRMDGPGFEAVPTDGPVVVHGHFDHDTVRDCEWADDSQIVTVLRDPVSRIVSLYNYWRSWTWSSIEKLELTGPSIAKSRSLRGFLLSSEFPVTVDVCSGMCRQFAGVALHNRYLQSTVSDAELAAVAIGNLRKFGLVTIMQKLDLTLGVIGYRLGIGLSAQPLGVNRFEDLCAEPGFEWVDPVQADDADIAIIRERSVADMLVYDYLERHGNVLSLSMAHRNSPFIAT